MLQCDGADCGVWQHVTCNALDPHALPETFFCERCRLSLSDPFCARPNSFGGSHAFLPTLALALALALPSPQP